MFTIIGKNRNGNERRIRDCTFHLEKESGTRLGLVRFYTGPDQVVYAFSPSTKQLASVRRKKVIMAEVRVEEQK